jgi:hypothetical protein
MLAVSLMEIDGGSLLAPKKIIMSLHDDQIDKKEEYA